MIMSPPDGTALRATSQTFVWTGESGSVRLRVGSSQGASDIYQSPPLEGVQSHLVKGLPLDGSALFVQLVRSSDGAALSESNSYRSPLRKGLCVVADFADRRLEDWQGPGMTDMDDVSTQLRAMEAHWDWLSRGLEKTQWDTIRVQLAQPLTDDAFPGWPQLRDAVLILARQKIDALDYDVNSDGIIDVVWIIASNGGLVPPYLIGGTSQNQDARNFLDGQNSDSVIPQATGNFNHEVGHCLDLRDLYDGYATIGDLSLMASTWPLPPNDFCAFDRIKLGWVEPRIVATSTAGLVLSESPDVMAAIKIPTVRAEEYFLIEYRKRPTSGYGSAASFDFDGLAVYHALEFSSQAQDPPLLKLEPADGIIVPARGPEANDLASPGSPPMVLRTYFGGDAVFSLQNLRHTAQGMAFDVVILSDGAGSAANLITNSSLEGGSEDWVNGGYLPAEASFSWASVGANGSEHSLSVSAPSPNDVEWRTHVADLVAGHPYYMCGFIKGQDVLGGAGASLSLSGTFTQTPGLFGTFDWTRVCMVITATDVSTDVACRLGGFSATTSGTMWCDDVTLTPLQSAFGP